MGVLHCSLVGSQQEQRQQVTLTAMLAGGVKWHNIRRDRIIIIVFYCCCGRCSRPLLNQTQTVLPLKPPKEPELGFIIASRAEPRFRPRNRDKQNHVRFWFHRFVQCWALMWTLFSESPAHVVGLNECERSSEPQLLFLSPGFTSFV